MLLLASATTSVVRQHARFVQWRGTWSHIITASACPRPIRSELPSAIWSPAWVLERRDLERSIGWCGSEPERRVRCAKRCTSGCSKATRLSRDHARA
jgi:hypothetical protein